MVRAASGRLALVLGVVVVGCVGAPDDGQERAVGELVTSQGTVTVQARASGYRSGDEFVQPGGLDPRVDCYDQSFDFDVSYVNRSLPWGVKVTLVSAMSGVEWSPDINDVEIYDYFDWRYQEDQEISARAGWTWGGARHQWSYPGGGSFDKFHFVFEIRYPDGSVRWDNGGSGNGYYEIAVPHVACTMGWVPYETTASDFADVPVRAVPRY
jgi:hypothetical protein